MIPKQGTLNVSGLSESVDLEQLFSVPKDFWKEECDNIQKYFEEQVGEDLPNEIANQLKELRQRLG